MVGEYNNTYHRTIKMKHVDVKDTKYIDFKKEVNEKDPKFKVGDHVRISKYKNIFDKGYNPNWSEEVFVVNKIKKTIPWTYVTSELNGEEITGRFYEEELEKQIQKNLEQKKYLKEQVMNSMSNAKDMIIHLIVRLIKKTLHKNGSILS